MLIRPERFQEVPGYFFRLLAKFTLDLYLRCLHHWFWHIFVSRWHGRTVWKVTFLLPERSDWVTSEVSRFNTLFRTISTHEVVCFTPVPFSSLKLSYLDGFCWFLSFTSTKPKIKKNTFETIRSHVLKCPLFLHCFYTARVGLITGFG